MGMIQHDAIIVTGWNLSITKDIRDKAIEIFNTYIEKNEDGDIETNKYNCVSNVVGTEMNQYMTFIIAPDGSKEGWGMSDDFDIKRKDFVEFLKTLYYSDGSACFSWVWVSYGETGRRVIKSNCKNMY